MGYNDWDDENKPALEGDHDWQATAGDFDSIPVIDVSELASSDIKARTKIAAEIRDACTRVGFFYISNHGISQDLIDRVFKTAENFFDLPFEDKMEVFMGRSTNFRGYVPIGASGKPGPDGKGSQFTIIRRENPLLIVRRPERVISMGP